MKRFLLIAFIFSSLLSFSQETRVPKEQLGNLKISYSDVGGELVGSVISNSLIWDISASPIRYCNNPGSGNINFTNAQINKSITVILNLTVSRTINWPSNAIILDGAESITGVTGIYYIYIHCISSDMYIVSVNKEKI